MNKLDEIALRVGIDEDQLEDLARSEFETAMSFGISLDNFMRLARTVNKRSSAALLAELSNDAEPVAYGAFYFGGENDGKLYAHCDDMEAANRYVAMLHQSSDCITLRVGPLFTIPIPANTAEIEQRVAEACAKVVLDWLDGFADGVNIAEEIRKEWREYL